MLNQNLRHYGVFKGLSETQKIKLTALVVLEAASPAGTVATVVVLS